jgi:hypothetical protein
MPNEALCNKAITYDRIGKQNRNSSYAVIKENTLDHMSEGYFCSNIAFLIPGLYVNEKRRDCVIQKLKH